MTRYIAALWKAGAQSNIDDQPIIITAGCLRQAAKDHPELEFNEEDQTLYATAECKGNISLEVIVPTPVEPFTIETVLLPPQDIETCTVADQFCEAPANLEPPETAQYSCFGCEMKGGDSRVCGKCSTLRGYKGYKRVRLCNNCQIEMDGNSRMVMVRMRRLAGYK